MRDIRVGVAFDVLNVVSGVFSRDVSVFVSPHGFALCTRVEAQIFSSLVFEPIEGSPVIDKGG
jgi:hypothetical protein